MRYINHKSDFQVIINIKDKEGNIVAPPSVPWEAVFADENGCEFTCYFDGTNYTHCIVDGNDIVCFVDNPGFSCGNLRCTFCQHVPSAEYCDGVMDLTQPLQCDIMLSKRESDDSTPITIDASPNWVRGPQGEQGIQGPQGIKGDKGDQGDKGEKGDQGERGLQGVQGVKGDDGISPTVTTSKTGKVTTIEITDANGVHTATVNDGDSVEVVQSTGTSTTAVMSQKAVSNIVDELESQVIYDVTANNSGATFDSLSALLSNENLSTLIPSEVRCGGMSIRFIQGSDNKYVQYRLIKDIFSTTHADWQGVDDEPTAGSQNLVKSGGAFSSISAEIARANIVGKNAFGFKTRLIYTSEISTFGQYITTDGNIVQLQDRNYRTYGPFVLHKGESIDIDVFGKDICALAEINNGDIIPIYNIKENIKNAFDVSYVTDRDIELMICSSKKIGNNGNSFWVKTILPTNVIAPEAEPFKNVEWSILNKYIDLSGNLVSYDDYGVSSPIHLNRGDLLKFDLSFSNVSCLSSFNNGVYKPIYSGLRADFDELSYYALEDIDVVLCGTIIKNAQYSILSTNDKPITKSQVENRMSSLLDFNISETRIVTIGIRNAYIDTHGVIHDYDGYYVSSPIFIKTGEKIEATFRGNEVAAISKVVDGVYTPVVNSIGLSTYQWVADEDCEIVLCGDSTLGNDCEYTITTLSDVKSVLNELNKIVKDGMPDFHLLNPYAGANYDNQVPAQTHEHCFTKEKLENAYNRGIRLVSCSHYSPSTPRYPFSGFDSPYQDYKSKQAVLDGDLEMVTRHTTGAIPIINVNDGDVQTDDIPQIANAERAFLTDISGHFNILGLLWGSAGNGMCNGELTNSSEDTTIKKNHSLESTTKFNELLEDESMWQFGAKYAFGTINHMTSKNTAITMLDRCPAIFKAMEIFNQGYSTGWNENFKSAFDSVLKSGYKIWGTAVVDWQGDWATWAFTTAEEQAEWEAKFLKLPADEQSKYVNAEGYYMATGRIQKDRGCNVLLMDGNYSQMSASEKAKEGIKAYIAGRYYMSAWNTKSMKLITDHHLVTFKVSDIADKIVLVTGKVRMEYENTDTINYVAQKDDIFIRFEAYWADGEFVYSNPVFVLK